ncbi:MULTISPECIES: GntR family transcriptional regulator [unclassified Treponema]|uniref:GntR family transcriptional regulator n=1 Tax=unclassified Treponema TaxID=2638727 RepID=UPI0020A5E64F|nr:MULTISPECIES: GntR family transcriptional regulator [unclassified Treponema]UTC67455.1 GntR family transcriptional regulator [Treponema sp. OMZ 789]UTC70183.1 GntR family transcriptional regulator [Treponema sp. OMZ 790]UTC72898.1 GntR family transcriptional regulator [Treponema sp. OMZ 791]
MINDKLKTMKTSLKQNAYVKIYDLVMENTITPGDIINLSDLEKYLKISRAPIRDALIELCSENVFKSIPRYGYELITLKKEDLIEMLNYRLVLECGFLEKNWKDVAACDHAILNHLLDHTRKLSNTNAVSEWQNNSVFHIGLFKLHNNSHALFSLEHTMKKMTRFFIQNYRGKWEEITKKTFSSHHENIIYAIKDNDKAKALKYLSLDIGGFKR